ncbi:hypothetical protein BMS3Bbin02_00954 [bacterium BMS3Bbin02]|nr:hypothetical protein BMS3Bbin02_00954 [bacterium BMS3Bbin02]
MDLSIGPYLCDVLLNVPIVVSMDNRSVVPMGVPVDCAPVDYPEWWVVYSR